MRTLIIALSTSLMVGLVAQTPLAQDSSHANAASGVAVQRAASIQAHLGAQAARRAAQHSAQQGPKHAPAGSPAEARAHARRLAEFHAWQQAQADHQLHSEQSRLAHQRRAAVTAARRAVASHQGSHHSPTNRPGQQALERMVRVQSQAAHQANTPKSHGSRAPRPARTRSAAGHKPNSHQNVHRPAVRKPHKKPSHHSSRSRGR